MKGIPTKKTIMSGDKDASPYWGFMRIRKNIYMLGKIHPGKGCANIIKFETLNPGAAESLFYDLYQQLKGIFEGISEHH